MWKSLGLVGLMTNHSWDENEIKRIGNSRCSKCGIQYEYYNRNLKDLNSWTEEEKKSELEHWNELIKSFQECVPRH